MRVEHLLLENIKCFERFEATFSPGFNVLLGENGTGKSTILTLVARVLSQWTPSPESVLQTKEHRDRVEFEAGNAFRRPVGEAVVRVKGVGVGGEPFQIAPTEPGGTVTNSDIAHNRLLARTDRDPGLPLPLLVLFSPWREERRKARPRKPYNGPTRRSAGYEGAFDLKADLSDFAAWFKALEQARQETSTPRPSLEAARGVLIGCIPGATDFRYHPDLNDICVTFEGGQVEPVWRLSDGYRTTIALIGELAWRATVLNPAFGDRVASEVTGVVLIDELDLHLHPGWQRRIVDDLRRAFPRVQFITTTHSPFIVQALQPDEVINLTGVGPSARPTMMSPEDIAEELMGIRLPQRSRRWQEMYKAAAEYFEVLERRKAVPEEVQALERRLDELRRPFSDDPAFAAFLERKRAVAER